MEENASNKSLISKEMKITGSIESSGALQIDGKLDGEIKCTGNVMIGKDANIKGNVESSSVTVSGTVNGNVIAKDKIEMKSSAKVVGDIKAKRLAVEDGVSFVGKSEVNPSGESKPAGGETTQKNESQASDNSGSGDNKNKGFSGAHGGKR